MATARVEQYIQEATVLQLKEKLTSFGLQTNGNKAELKLRLQEHVAELDESEISAHFANVQDEVESIAQEDDDLQIEIDRLADRKNKRKF